MKLKAKCDRCRTRYEFWADDQDVRDWHEGKLIQVAIPYLSIEARELLISGMCGDCFNELAKDLHD